MDTEMSAGEIVVTAQNEATWTLFVRSGRAALVGDGTLRRAQKDLERRLTTAKAAKGSRECWLAGSERIRSYLAEVEQVF